MVCKVCINRNLRSLEEQYYYCEHCDLIFVDGDEILEPEEEKERYEQHDNNHENRGYVRMFERFIEIVIVPYLEERDTALDFGCGPGPVLAELLEERGLSVDVYDPYFFPKDVYRGKKYDLITSTEVFEHLKEPLLEIEKLVKCLKKGGYLAIMTSFHSGWKEFNNWGYQRDPTHITFYNSKTFRKIVERFPVELIFEDGEKYCLFKKV